MNSLDALIACVLAFGCLLGLLKGLSRLVYGVAALVAAFFAAAYFHDSVAAFFVGRLAFSPVVAGVVAYVVVFQAVLLFGGLSGVLQAQFLRAADLGWLDRVAGVLLGAVAALVVLAFVALPVAAYLPPAGDVDVVAGSSLAPLVDRAAANLATLVPAHLRLRYTAGIAGARERWQACRDSRGRAAGCVPAGASQLPLPGR